jgi:serine/threonine-protein kinase
LVGQTVLNYKVTSRLAEGGMGAVYEAEHSLLGRRVAIKVLRRDRVDDERSVQRFLNEARAANAIRHPNIVELLDAGTYEDQGPYLVMELLEGESLAARLRSQGAVRVAEAIAIGQQVADALAAAHGAGIVHRDLTAENVFIHLDETAPRGERVKVLDFGIAKLHEESPDTVHTSTGAVVGTPPYMSPEQCRGRSSEIDHRTDIYGLGVILFEMLCGVPPFIAEGVGEVLLLHMTSPPPAPSSINPDVPAWLEQLILKALAKDKRDRFASMAELHHALGHEGALPEPVVAAQPVSEAAAEDSAPSPIGDVAPAPVAVREREPVTTLSWMVGTLAEIRSLAWFGQRRRAALAAGLALSACAAVLMVIVTRSSAHPRGRQLPASPDRPPALALPGAGAAPASLGWLVTDLPADLSGLPGSAPVPAPVAPAREATTPELCTITIGSRPWSEVWIDGRRTGQLTPLLNYKVPCGRRELTLRNSDLAIARSAVVTLKQGQKWKKVFHLLEPEQ